MGDFRNYALWVIIVLLLLALFTLFQNPSSRPAGADISFSQFLNEIDQGRVRDVLIRGAEITGTFTDGRSFHTYAPYDRDPTLLQRLYGKGVSISARPLENVPWLVSLVAWWLPFIALIGVWIFLSRRMLPARSSATGSSKEIDDLKRQVADLQKRLDELGGKDKA